MPLAESGSTEDAKEINDVVQYCDSSCFQGRPALAGKHEGAGPSDREAIAEGTLEWRPLGFRQQGLEGALPGHRVCLGHLTRSVHSSHEFPYLVFTVHLLPAMV